MLNFYSYPILEQVLSRTDMALAKAQTENVNSWAVEQQDSDENQFGQQH